MATNIGKFLLKSGDRISCRIKGQDIIDAKIYFQDENTSYIRGWICHNNSNFSGDRSPRLFNYKYSWAFNITSNGISDGVENIIPFLPGDFLIKDNVHICSDISHFLKIKKLNYILPLFYCKVGIFDEFEKYKMSEIDGCIVLLNDRKSVEIKFSRFVRQLSLKLNEYLDSFLNKSIEVPGFSKIEISDKEIENIHNLFVAFQKNEKCNIQILTGDDILKGYERLNYPSQAGGTLHKSCMVDQLSFLNIYTKNPNQVKLAVIYNSDNKIIARSLLWIATDGKTYSDRVYYQFDWLDKFTIEKLRDMGITPISEQGIKTVQLEKWEFDKYPYVDSFFYFDKINGTLLSIGAAVRQLRNTNGNG